MCMRHTKGAKEGGGGNDDALPKHNVLALLLHQVDTFQNVRNIIHAALGDTQLRRDFVQLQQAIRKRGSDFHKTFCKHSERILLLV